MSIYKFSDIRKPFNIGFTAGGRPIRIRISAGAYCRDLSHDAGINTTNLTMLVDVGFSHPEPTIDIKNGNDISIYVPPGGEITLHL